MRCPRCSSLGAERDDDGDVACFVCGHIGYASVIPLEQAQRERSANVRASRYIPSLTPLELSRCQQCGAKDVDHHRKKHAFVSLAERVYA